MAIKYLKDDSTMLAVVCAVRGVDFGHINYVRHNTYQHLLYSGGLFSTIHLDLATQYINKQTEGTVGYMTFIQCKTWQNLHIHSKMRTFHNWLRNW